MLEGLDEVPWGRLKHAYGTAGDVPELLRALRTPAPEDQEETALWQLFGNIHHQGTIYEAATYAVPFLLQLVAARRTPDRAGILNLLGAIAAGDPVGKKAREARSAVGSGFDTLVSITREKGEVRLAAAQVLAQLPERSGEVQRLLLGLLATERREQARAGLLLLLGQTRAPSAKTLAALGAGLEGSRAERRAATVSLARAKPRSLPPGFGEAVLEAIDANDLEESVEDLPWDAAADVLCVDLEECLRGDAKERSAVRLIQIVEKGKSEDGHVRSLLDLLFKGGRHGRRSPWKAAQLSLVQARAIRALARARKKRRIFYGSFEDWGLPETNREWSALADGRDPEPIDMSLPLLASPARPKRVVRAATLKPGDRVLHRHYGLGTVKRARPEDGATALAITFDDEGSMNLLLD